MTAPQIIDRTRIAMGWSNPWQTRTIASITHIGVHHSGTASGNTAAFENSWRNLGWRNGGYGWVILTDGRIEHNYPHTIVTNGVAGHNAKIVNVCVVGNGSFTPAQETSLDWLIRRLVNELPNVTGFNRVLGHNEFANQATACPGRNMVALRNRLSQPVTTPPTPSGGFSAGDLNQDVRVTSDTLNVRSARNATSAIRRTLRKGDIVRIRWVLGINNANPVDTPWGSINGATNEFINLNFVELVASQRTHKVVNGDTLWALSQRFGVTVAQIQQANGMGSSTTLSVGTVLVIPN